jgi:hypothetical protein
MWSIWPSYQRLLLLSKNSRNKSQRRKDVPLGESWIVHIFHRMRNEAILLLHIMENTWQIVVINSQLYLSKVN